MRHDPALDPVRRAARPLDDLDDVDAVVRAAAGAQLVLLGEATHGTREFYALRAAITRRLIEQHGFDGVALEADWPDAQRVHRFVQGGLDDANARQALESFTRFPRWMWRNREFLRLVQWLRAYNDLQPQHRRAGVYGLDLYSLHGSIQAVLAYLEQHEPQMARQARERYGCFDHFLDDPQRYGQAAHFGLSEGCQREVLQQLQAMMAKSVPRIEEGRQTEDDLFHAQLNALVVRNAERYYRIMFQGSNASWNQRDRHMHQVLQRVREHLTRTRGHPARLVVWAHNSHLGDARATEMGADGQLNLGQLVREAAGPGESFNLGFSTDHGSVAAASDWDAPVEFKRVTPARPDSWEGLLHDTGLDLFLLPLGGDELQRLLAPPRLERAIGVIYRPETERQSHYFEASLSQQFDAVLHVDRSHALHPLDGAAPPQVLEEPETFPSGL
ncbi:erythromycin esterase family protein [Azohydromonas caseinilytica]|uniref:Erythromycin esterase family protein n=1 Tax=Azohydromonas caseinilytica TaxID=2728836 RepID=A0A848FBB6_9BURK|nr:erythromycin esterase family protein [Azohydromonas caseinilytica]NML15251.1 erythromycin esterase family protein [Azohydromonas caseinilytica]